MIIRKEGKEEGREWGKERRKKGERELSNRDREKKERKDCHVLSYGKTQCVLNRLR